jgi:hypothetical protein
MIIFLLFVGRLDIAIAILFRVGFIKVLSCPKVFNILTIVPLLLISFNNYFG